MKTTAALAALLAAGAVAQPHIHARHAHPQHHRDLDKRGRTKTDWVTVWETKYVTVDGPVPTTTRDAAEAQGSPGNFKDHPEEDGEDEEETPTNTTPTPTPEPEPTTEEEPEPTETTEEVPPPEETTTTTPPPQEPTTTTAEPEPTTTTGGGGGGNPSGESHSGFITYYSVGLGACGETDVEGATGSFDDPMVVALSFNVFFASLANTNKFELCNKKILIESPDKPGVQAYGIIRDACQACTTIGDIDVNQEGMKQFYDDPVQVGKGSITWTLLE